jgi:hypothetical protein
LQKRFQAKWIPVRVKKTSHGNGHDGANQSDPAQF